MSETPKKIKNEDTNYPILQKNPQSSNAVYQLV